MNTSPQHPEGLTRTGGLWIVAAIVITSILAIAATIYSLQHGINDVHQFLFFIPIIICVWFSPKRGVLFTLALSIIYLLLVYSISNFSPALVAVSTAWFVIFVTIGVVTSSFAQGLLNERRKFWGIFENSQAGIFTCDCATMRIVEINSKCTRLLQAEPGDLTRKPLAEIMTDPKEYEMFRSEIRRNQQVGDIELHFTTATGDVRQVLVSASLSLGNTILCSVADITERKLAERVIHKAREDLEQRVMERTRELTRSNEVLIAEIDERRQFEEAITLANRKLNTLSSITRHDILNQVTAIVMYLSLAEEEVHDPALITEHLKKIEQVTDLIQKQIRFTQDYQYIGTRPPAWQNVGSTVDMAMRRLGTHELRIEKTLAHLEIFADHQLEKVFYNLLENTLHHGEHATVSRFSYRECGDQLVIVYEDDGIGILAGAKEKIFKREYYRNSGYGLFLAREILGTTGMTMQENGEPGRGARFEITVPKGAFRLRNPDTRE